MHTVESLPSKAAGADVFRYRIEFSDEQGELRHAVPLESAEFQRAVYATSFFGLRRGLFAVYDPQLDRASIQPIFPEGSDGTARTAGFRVTVRDVSGSEATLDFGIGYFSSRATALRSQWIRAQQQPPETNLLYQLSAYLDDGEPARRPVSGISLGPTSLQIPIREGERRDFGPAEAWDAPDLADLPVLIGQSLLEEAVEESQRAPDREIGGLLLGNVRRESTGDLFLEVTCYVSGDGTTPSSSGTHVTFTGETFAKAREMIALRRNGGMSETIVGWCHSHPFRFCVECPLPPPPECIAKILFYSAEDRHLMESTFPHPFMVGLLTAVEPKLERVLGHLPLRLFGWRAGEIQQRGFHVIQ